ncbi:MAG TPA: hypothetical protein VG916_03710 [Gemmatimonadaceae bacterium]|nr:hypothetical protein [Gemmatimonadaceae bacterium]
MNHCFMYHGGFERNFPNLKPGATTFEGTDGATHQIPPWPAGADGVCFGYMEKAGKKFMAVRVVHGATDVVLPDAMILDGARHMGHGKRFGAAPTLVDDDGVIITLLEDIMKKNPGTANALMPVRMKLKAPPKKK